MFIIIVNYVQPLAQVDQFLVEHRQFLDECYQKGALLMSGPQHPRVGGILISPLTERTALEALLAQDPFSIHSIAQYQLIEFTANKYQAELAKYCAQQKPTVKCVTPIIKEALTVQEIKNCFKVAQEELRPYLNEDTFTSRVIRQQQQGYHLMYMEKDNNVVAIMGYRINEYLAWGRMLYIDDLATLRSHKKQGLARQLLNFAVAEGQRHACQEIHLDSGYKRLDAHRLYLNYGFVLSSHHFSLRL